MNFKGLGEAQAKERVQFCLLARIKEVFGEEMVGDDLGNMYPLTAPLARPTLQLGSKRPRDEEPKLVAELRK